MTKPPHTCAQCGAHCDRRARRCKACHMADYAFTPERSVELNAIREAKRARLAALAQRAIDAGLDREELSQ